MSKFNHLFLNPDEIKESVIINMVSAHADERGYIQTLLNCSTENIAYISSKKGTIRSNHYHKTDWHFMYMISGASLYYYREVGSTDEPKILNFNAGDLIFTPPMEEHSTLFTEDSVLLAMSKNPRDQAAYEADVVRVELISNKTVGV